MMARFYRGAIPNILVVYKFKCHELWNKLLGLVWFAEWIFHSETKWLLAGIKESGIKWLFLIFSLVTTHIL
jgi:hypothetical protein